MGKKKDQEPNGAAEEDGKSKKKGPLKGPIENRSCTDIICCILFLLCFAGMIAVAVLAFLRGDPVRLLYPTDSNGNICGNGDLKDKPKLFFFDLVDCAKAGVASVAVGCPTPQVCVEKCPDTNFFWGTSLINGLGSNQDDIKSKLICKYGIDTSSKSVQQLVEDDDCAGYYVKSNDIAGRCIPAIFADILNKTAGLVTSDGMTIVNKVNKTLTLGQLEEGTKALAVLVSATEYGQKIYQDVRAAWWMILVGLCIAMLLAFIWIVIMRWIVCPMVWLTIVLFIGVFAVATFYCIRKYLSLRGNEDSQLQGSFVFTTNVDYYANLAITWLVFGCVAGAVALITLLIVIFLWKRIMIAINLIKEASKAISSMILTLFFPLFPVLLEIILFAFWGASAIYLASMGSAKYTNNMNSTHLDNITDKIDCSILDGNSSVSKTFQGICSFVKYGGDEYTIYLQFFQLFMLFWCMNFIVAFGQMTLAGAFASYYWAFKKPKDIPTFPLAASAWRSLRYHLGTLAFGSLIIAIIQLIRVLLEYMDHKLRGSENPVAKFMLKCCKCCFWCLEKFMKFLNKNAYIMCAIYGKNFCTSAKDAFSLILRNIIRVAVTGSVTSYVLFLCKLFIVGAVGVVGYFFFNGQIPGISTLVSLPTLNFNVVPVIILCIGSYIIASAFFSVYSMAVNTLFLCFLEDLERNDGSENKPYYMSKGLMRLLSKKNVKPKDE